MATKKKRPARARPKTPARVKKRTRKAKPRSHQHPELVGLALAAAGLFLATILYLGWDGGVVGDGVEDGVRAVVGGATYLVPLLLVALGALMLLRSALVDVRPFRNGVALLAVGLLVVLGRGHGGALGRALAYALGHLVGRTGALVVGVFLLIAAVLLLTGRGLAAATRERLERAGARVIGLDLHGAEVTADLSRADERRRAVEEAQRRAEDEQRRGHDHQHFVLRHVRGE
jgi:hypothetical protein